MGNEPDKIAPVEPASLEPAPVETAPIETGSVDMVAYRARQKARNRAMGLVLGALVVLFFAITIVKLGIQASHPH